jgi:hypothetical protein
MKTASAAKVKSSRLRAIDKGTSYDVPGRMKRLARSIERGEFGEVTDVVCVVRSKNQGEIELRPYFYGKSDTANLHFMLSRALDRCIK